MMPNETTIEIDHTWWDKFFNGEMGLNGATENNHHELMQDLVKTLSRYSSSPEFRVGVLEQPYYAAKEYQKHEAELKRAMVRRPPLEES